MTFLVVCGMKSREAASIRRVEKRVSGGAVCTQTRSRSSPSLWRAGSPFCARRRRWMPKWNGILMRAGGHRRRATEMASQ